MPIPGRTLCPNQIVQFRGIIDSLDAVHQLTGRDKLRQGQHRPRAVALAAMSELHQALQISSLPVNSWHAPNAGAR